jgi:hypothetical protein
VTTQLYLNLSLTNPTGGMVLGHQATEALGISAISSPPTIAANITTPPVGGNVMTPAKSLTLTFDQTLAAAPLAGSFTLSHRTNELANGVGKSTALSLASVTYNPTSLQLKIDPTKALQNNQFYQLTAPGSAAHNVYGQNLDGAGTGVAGTPYVASFGAGRNLTYIDRNGNRVHLVLKGPGIIHLTRTPDGQGETLSVLGATAKTKLTGSVRHTRFGGAGTTTLAEITGLDQAKVTLNGVQFVVSAIKP